MPQLQGTIAYLDSSSGRPDELVRILQQLYFPLAPVNDDSCAKREECRIRMEVLVGKFGPVWLKNFQDKLQELGQLPDNWNGLGSAAPNSTAEQNTQSVLDVLHGKEESFAPTGISASAEEGIALIFEKGEKYGFIECFNHGKIVAAYSDGKGKRKIWIVRDSHESIEDALENIGDFLNA